MNYGNYAPFYRGGYFDPSQTMVNTPMYPQMPQQQPTNGFLFVLSQTEAESYPVAANSVVVLWDKNTPTIYIKSADAQGVPSMRILNYTERTMASPGTPNSAEYAKQDEFKALQDKVEALTTKFNEMTKEGNK